MVMNKPIATSTAIVQTTTTSSSPSLAAGASLAHDDNDKNLSPYFRVSRRTRKKNDNLLSGPCSTFFEDLKDCGSKQNITRYVDQLEKCSIQTDRLIKCVNKYPKQVYNTHRHTTSSRSTTMKQPIL